MSITHLFVPKELQSHDNAKYIAGLLSAQLLKISKEHEALEYEEQALEQQIQASASNQSIEFVRVLKDPTNMKNEAHALKESALVLKSQVEVLEELLTAKLPSLEKSVSFQEQIKQLERNQHIVSELLHIPVLLKTLVNTHHYPEALSVIEYVKGFPETESKVLKGISLEVAGITEKIFSDLQELVGDSPNAEVCQKHLDMIVRLKGLERDQLPSIFLQTKHELFNRKAGKHALPVSALKEHLLCVNRYLPQICEIYRELFSDFPSGLRVFVFEVAFGCLERVKEQLGKVEKVEEMREIAECAYKVDSETFEPAGCTIANEVYNALAEVCVSCVRQSTSKTYSHFENMVRLYQWETSGQKENPLMEFGTIAVLYSNIIGIINQARLLPLKEMKEVLFGEVKMLLQKTVEYSFSKGGHLLTLENLTRQQNIYKGLFVKYLTVRDI